MKLIIEKNYEDMSQKAATIIAKSIREKPDLVLGLATGSTPIGTYKELIRMHKEEGLDFSQVTTFNLDEYIGLAPEDVQSYYHFMFETLFNHINIKKENIHIPDGKTEDIESFCRKYEADIKNSGGIDLQILGIGVNGHIGFNEPAEELIFDTHLTDLAEETIKSNSRFFDSPEEVPRKAITMGIGSIMRAKKIMLLANGKNKAPIISQLVENNAVTTQNPASLLKLHHDVVVLVDEEAASFFKNCCRGCCQN